MQNKMIAIIAVIVVLFGALFFVINYKNSKALENNPYGTDDLNQATIDQLKDPDYGNQILPDELKDKVESGEAVTVYFYDPLCSFCKATTPYLVPLAEDMGVDMKKLNLLEFRNDVQMFGIQYTPTLVHYENGKEVMRLESQQTEEVYAAFFDEYVLK